MRAKQHPFPYQGDPGVDPPSSIGRYQLIRELGRGAMARVYLAEDPNIGRRIALKVLAPGGPVDADLLENLRQRFLLEARAAGNLRHPSAVAIFDADHDSETGLSYIVMEWVDGRSLHQVLQEGRCLTVPQVVTTGQQVAAALDAAHQQGLIHRDVKPANILLDHQGNAKLSDFGIAKLESLDLTSTGQVLGTPYYMSPEQIRTEELDGRSDLYSLGVVLYQCLTGSLPFAGDSLASVTHKILTADPRPPRWLNEDIPEHLSAVVSRALAKSREARFQTGAELSAALATETRPHLAPVSLCSPVTSSGTEVLTHPRASSSEGATAKSAGSRLRIALELIALVLALMLLMSDLWPPDPAPPATTQTLPVAEQEAQTPSAKTDAAGSAPVAQAAQLQIEFTNRLKRGTFTVWIDGELVLTRTLSGPKGLLKRFSGQDVVALVPVEPGHHVIEIRARGVQGKYEVARQTAHFFTQGTTYRLGVEVIPPRFLRFLWK